jgi:hypothetical protein
LSIADWPGAASVSWEAISSLMRSFGMAFANRMTSTANFFVRAFRSSGVVRHEGARGVPIAISRDQSESSNKSLINDQKINNESTIKDRTIFNCRF